jgi:hypothetical protein
MSSHVPVKKRIYVATSGTRKNQNCTTVWKPDRTDKRKGKNQGKEKEKNQRG